jgi:hypothetical protein
MMRVFTKSSYLKIAPRKTAPLKVRIWNRSGPF